MASVGFVTHFVPNVVRVVGQRCCRRQPSKYLEFHLGVLKIDFYYAILLFFVMIYINRCKWSIIKFVCRYRSAPSDFNCKIRLLCWDISECLARFKNIY